MTTADEIFMEAFSKPREQRSPEYKRGVLAALKFRLEGVKLSSPFPEGTATADAFSLASVRVTGFGRICGRVTKRVTRIMFSTLCEARYSLEINRL